MKGLYQYFIFVFMAILIMIPSSLFSEGEVAKVAILDFVNEGGSGDEYAYFSKSIPQALKNELILNWQRDNETRHQFIERSVLLDKAKQENINQNSFGDKDEAIKLAKAVGADFVVYGSYRIRNEKVEVKTYLSSVFYKDPDTQSFDENQRLGLPLFDTIDFIAEQIKIRMRNFKRGSTPHIPTTPTSKKVRLNKGDFIAVVPGEKEGVYPRYKNLLVNTIIEELLEKEYQIVERAYEKELYKERDAYKAKQSGSIGRIKNPEKTIIVSLWKREKDYKITLEVIVKETGKVENQVTGNVESERDLRSYTLRLLEDLVEY